ncbi:putative NRPS-like enzyme [Aspergillus sclerotioniger CBS 115572]|uniref:Putative NRPS-like enzyme n=1 Tax=Aspergillus sclerotioniger CBS 115572 TaxID=1450535 RepID=A0A317V061_9EURO|nr:putative NRPS-like enzyme [Aspergillus sclerotioniger CBS 115572]PWY67643.1 putative NRPS-like enzyme [Aspergillus sclerotioniger CBS 115572]
MEKILINHARDAPDAVAVIDQGRSLTYAELFSESNHLSERLKAEIDPGSTIGILLGPGVKQVVAQFAVRLADCVCVPIEPSVPKRRLTDILQDAQVKHIIMEDGQLELPDSNRFDFDIGQSQLGTKFQNPPVDITSEHSHILFTSGSTGRPKPVQIRADGILHLATETPATPLSCDDRVASFNNPGFDLSLFEIWVTLIARATIVIVPRRIATDPGAMPSFLQENEVTVLIITAALFNIMASDQGAFHTLKHVLTAGDVANVRAMREVLEHAPPAHLWNTYGPTECTTLATMLEVTLEETKRDRIGIGGPVGQMEVFLIDHNENPIHQSGQPGEICISGPQQTRGYLNRPAENKKCFLCKPRKELVPGKNEMRNHETVRLYRTGDIGEWRPGSGNLDFVGRSDTQVKHKGFRVELGEVERVLHSCEAIRGAVVIQQPPQSDEGMPVLICFVHLKPSSQFGPENILDFARDRLPSYMVPEAVEIVAEFPLTPHGKVDRKALLETRLKRLDHKASDDGPNGTSHVQEQRAMIHDFCKEILGVADIHDHDDFFQRGATSLQAAALLALIQDQLGCSVSMEDLYCHSTVSDLVHLVGQVASPTDAPDHTRQWMEDINQVDQIEVMPHWESASEGKVFLTGATGFVGAHLLHHLLNRPMVKQVACLCRPRAHPSAADRIQKALERYDLWKSCQDKKHKLFMIEGDLTQDQLGLGPDRYDWLANWTSIIFHLGAKVDFCQSYREHYASNVVGTCNILQLAAAGRRKGLQYLSSIDAWGPTGFVLGTKELYEDGPLEPHAQALRYDLGYAQSQWVAEGMVRRMRARGLPIVIHRPGFIIGHGGTGESNPDDFVSRLIVGCIQLGVFPRLDQRLEYVTVDYVIAAVMHIAASPQCLGHSYSLLSPDQRQSATLQDTCRIINEAGYRVRLIDYKDWVQEVAAKQQRDGPLAPLQPMFRERVLGDLTRWEASQRSPRYRCDKTVQALQDRPDIRYQPFDAAMLQRFIAFWNRKGFYAI